MPLKIQRNHADMKNWNFQLLKRGKGGSWSGRPYCSRSRCWSSRSKPWLPWSSPCWSTPRPCWSCVSPYNFHLQNKIKKQCQKCFRTWIFSRFFLLGFWFFLVGAKVASPHLQIKSFQVFGLSCDKLNRCSEMKVWITSAWTILSESRRSLSSADNLTSSSL